MLTGSLLTSLERLLARIDSLTAGDGCDVVWWPCRFLCRSDDPRQLAWFASHWAASVNGSVLPIVREVELAAVVDDDLLVEIESIAAAVNDDDTVVRGFIDCDYRRVELGALTVWHTREGHGPNRHVIVSVDAEHWYVVSADNPIAHRNVVRVARELLRDELRRLDSAPIHGASVLVDRNAILFVGPSGYGKTTISLVGGRVGAFIGGDQTDLVATGDGWRAVGLPIITRVGWGTLQGLGLDRLAEMVPLLRVQEARTAGGIAPAAMAFGSLTKLEFTQLEVKQYVGVATATGGPLAAIVVLDRGDGERPEATAVPWKAAIETLKSNLLVPHNNWPEYWLAPAAEATSVTAANAVASLEACLENVRVMRLCWDPARHSAEEALDSAVRLL